MFREGEEGDRPRCGLHELSMRADKEAISLAEMEMGKYAKSMLVVELPLRVWRRDTWWEQTRPAKFSASAKSKIAHADVTETLLTTTDGDVLMLPRSAGRRSIVWVACLIHL